MKPEWELREEVIKSIAWEAPKYVIDLSNIKQLTEQCQSFTEIKHSEFFNIFAFLMEMAYILEHFYYGIYSI